MEWLLYIVWLVIVYLACYAILTWVFKLLDYFLENKYRKK